MANITGLPSTPDSPLSPMYLNPEFLGSLQNTLTPAGVLDQFAAEVARQQEAAAAMTESASKQAGAAGQAYQQAAQAPVPDVNPLAALARTSLGNVASVISGNKDYSERAREDVQTQRKNLVQARLDNLTALKATYERKAAALEQAGHDEEALKARLSIEKLSKTLDVLGKEQDHAAALAVADKQGANRLKEIAATGAEARRTEGVRSENETKLAQLKADLEAKGQTGVNIADNADLYTMADGTQVPYVNLGGIPLPKQKQAVRDAARSAGVPALNDKEASALKMVSSVKGDMQYITDNIIPLLPSSGGMNRVAQGTMNRARATFQVGETGQMLAGYPATRTAAIKTIQALASLGTGLRINQAEIKAAQDFDYPRIDDSQGTAKYKFKILDMMLGHIEGALLGRPASEAEVQKALRAAAAIKRGQIPAEKANDPLGIR